MEQHVLGLARLVAAFAKGAADPAVSDLSVANALVGAALHVVEDANGAEFIPVYAGMILGAAQNGDEVPAFVPSGDGTAAMCQFAQLGEKMQALGVSGGSVAAAMLAAAMNLWGAEKGFHEVAPWLRDTADRSDAAYGLHVGGRPH